MFAQPLCPNLQDFVLFIRTQLNISDQIIPNPVIAPGLVTDAPDGNQVTDSSGDPVWDNITNWLRIVLGIALEIVNDDIAAACSGAIYTLCVYNLAADILINITPDPPGQTLMSRLREKYGVLKPKTGVISSGSNESTSSAYLNPDWLKSVTLAQLQNMKTPWGRFYIGYAASVGTLWGLN